VRRSRFIATIKPTQTEQEAADFVEAVSEEFSTASHNVYAYRVGLGVLRERYSDDGEPSGTAGPPVLEVLKQRELLNIAVVVTRFFGGTKLGGGGLVRAYSHSASLAVQAAGEVTWQAYQELGVVLDYGQLGPLEYQLRQDRTPIVSMDYGQQVSATIHVRHNRLEKTVNTIMDLTSGQAELTRGSWLYLPEDQDGNRRENIAPVNPPAP
jgi:uncharacterized YigZ family protein